MNASSKGFSLVEILLVLGVISVIAVGAFIIYPRVSLASQAKAEAEKVRVIHASIAETMHRHSLFGATSAALVAANVVGPDDFQSPWGPIQFYPTIDGHGCTAAPGCNGFSLRYSAVPPAACVILVQNLAPTANKIRVQGVANHILKGSPAKGSPAGTPHVTYDPGQVPPACGDGDAVDVYVDMVAG